MENLLIIWLWYGLLSLVVVGVFASLGYEIERSFTACLAAQDDEAWRIVCATLNVNGLAMLASFLFIGLTCWGIGALPAHWRWYFVASVLITFAYFSYTRACERRLNAFLHSIGTRPE